MPETFHKILSHWATIPLMRLYKMIGTELQTRMEREAKKMGVNPTIPPIV